MKFGNVVMFIMTSQISSLIVYIGKEHYYFCSFGAILDSDDHHYGNDSKASIVVLSWENKDDMQVPEYQLESENSLFFFSPITISSRKLEQRAPSQMQIRLGLQKMMYFLRLKITQAS